MNEDLACTLFDRFCIPYWSIGLKHSQGLFLTVFLLYDYPTKQLLLTRLEN
jgi:hypothetical protein